MQTGLATEALIDALIRLYGPKNPTQPEIADKPATGPTASRHDELEQLARFPYLP